MARYLAVSLQFVDARPFYPYFNRASVRTVGEVAMNLFRFWLASFCLFLFTLVIFDSVGLAEPKVQILSPKDGTRISQDQKSIFVNGKVARDAGRSANVDIFLVIDISGSTAMYGGADLGDADQPPESSGFGMPQISIGGMSLGRPPLRNPRNSILAAEIA